MTNPESDRVETMCRAGDGAHGIEIITAREVLLGGLRAMPVRRTLPQRARSLIGAWCFLDHYGPDDVSVTGGMNVDAHPHIGLQTVSWLFSGEIEHRDSAGFHAMVRPGEMNLMTAGSGISHSERSTPSTTVLHGAQLWVVLPDSKRNMRKTFEHYEPPVLWGDGWCAQVFLGSLLGSVSPVVAHTPLVGAELRLEPGTILEVEVNSSFEHGLLLDSGELTLACAHGHLEGADHIAVAPADLAYVPAGVEALRLIAGAEGARLLFIGGEPFAEEIIMWWNFVGRTHEEIAQARADWQAELVASGVGDVTPVGHPESAGGPVPNASTDRFGLPDNEPAPPLPAPPLPIARLVPREKR